MQSKRGCHARVEFGRNLRHQYINEEGGFFFKINERDESRGSSWSDPVCLSLPSKPRPPSMEHAFGWFKKVGYLHTTT